MNGNAIAGEISVCKLIHILTYHSPLTRIPYFYPHNSMISGRASTTSTSHHAEKTSGDAGVAEEEKDGAQEDANLFWEGGRF